MSHICNLCDYLLTGYANQPPSCDGHHPAALLAKHDGDHPAAALMADIGVTNPAIIRRLLLSLPHGRRIETGKRAMAGSSWRWSPRRIDMAYIDRSAEDLEPIATPPKCPALFVRWAIACWRPKMGCWR
jgi:hypothetical protein